jgi:hypothetical protein
MQVHKTGETIDAGSVGVRLYGEMAIMTIGSVLLFVESAADADELMKAAAEARRLLDPPGPGGVEFGPFNAVNTAEAL